LPITKNKQTEKPDYHRLSIIIFGTPDLNNKVHERVNRQGIRFDVLDLPLFEDGVKRYGNDIQKIKKEVFNDKYTDSTLFNQYYKIKKKNFFFKDSNFEISNNYGSKYVNFFGRFLKLKFNKNEINNF
jgi:hypothetical protein